MVELQIISKVIESGDYSFIENNLLTADYFPKYADEFEFITNHYKKYGNVPDKATFLFHFPEIELVSLVGENDKYLLDTIREQYLYSKAVPVIQHSAELLKTDANAASEFLLQAVKELTPNYSLGGTDIIANADDRLNHLKDRMENQDDWYFSSGFPELDRVIHGIKRGEELIVIFARTNQGKSWVLEKMITHIWKQGYNVGYISPEMSRDSIGYRFDTLYKGFSNSALSWGSKDVNIEEYENYIKELKKQTAKFVVATPAEDFNNYVTVSKLRNFVKQHNIEALAIDGIKYLSDERGRRNDNLTTSLTNISEDLMSLSVELKIPILVVVQANRGGVVDKDSEGTPELESIRDSDGISHNASKVIALRQKDDALDMGLPKNREGKVGVHFKYLWNINVGEFTSVTVDDDAPVAPPERRERKQKSGKDIF